MRRGSVSEAGGRKKTQKEKRRYEKIYRRGGRLNRKKDDAMRLRGMRGKLDFRKTVSITGKQRYILVRMGDRGICSREREGKASERRSNEFPRPGERLEMFLNGKEGRPLESTCVRSDREGLRKRKKRRIWRGLFESRDELVHF